MDTLNNNFSSADFFFEKIVLIIGREFLAGVIC